MPPFIFVGAFEPGPQKALPAFRRRALAGVFRQVGFDLATLAIQKGHIEAVAGVRDGIPPVVVIQGDEGEVKAGQQLPESWPVVFAQWRSTLCAWQWEPWSGNAISNSGVTLDRRERVFFLSVCSLLCSLLSERARVYRADGPS